MTAEPAYKPLPMTRERFAVAAWERITAVLEAPHEDALEAIHAELCRDADGYAATLAEAIARPDDRWGPE